MARPLPSDIEFNTTTALFTYLNLISPILLPAFLFTTFFGFFFIQIRNNVKVENALFSSSFVTLLTSLMIYLMGELNGYVTVVVILLFGFSFAFLIWGSSKQ